MLWSIYWRVLVIYSVLVTVSVLLTADIFNYFLNETTIKLKPTALYLLISMQFFILSTIKRNIWGSTIKKSLVHWEKIYFTMSIVVCAMAVLNSVVAYNFDTDTWVSWKLFGGILGLLVSPIISAIGNFTKNYDGE